MSNIDLCIHRDRIPVSVAQYYSINFTTLNKSMKKKFYKFTVVLFKPCNLTYKIIIRMQRGKQELSFLICIDRNYYF